MYPNVTSWIARFWLLADPFVTITNKGCTVGVKSDVAADIVGAVVPVQQGAADRCFEAVDCAIGMKRAELAVCADDRVGGLAEQKSSLAVAVKVACDQTEVLQHADISAKLNPASLCGGVQVVRRGNRYHTRRRRVECYLVVALDPGNVEVKTRSGVESGLDDEVRV